ncbi:MAG: rRNA maturation RNase YbeY [Bdellovibrionia bacterium]
MLQVEIINQSATRVPRQFLLAKVKEIYRELVRRKIKIKAQQQLTVVFLDLEPARELNFRYRQKSYATDVLSFDGSSPEELGELVLCPQVLKEQAREHGLTYQQELTYMVLHGILHLLGYDHEKSKRQEKVMFAIQDEIFEKISP